MVPAAPSRGHEHLPQRPHPASQILERDGADVVGMTAMPEAALARELGLRYASCAVIANWAAGKCDEEISMDEIRDNLIVGMENARALLRRLVC